MKISLSIILSPKKKEHPCTQFGTEPHDWEPAPADIIKLENADLFIYNGAGMEHWVGDVLASLENKDLVVVEASAGIAFQEGHDHDHEHEESTDPHTWLSPANAVVELANIRDGFIKADGSHAELYNTNYENYSSQFEELDEEFRSSLSDYQDRKIVVSHEAFGYLCHEYGIVQEGIEGIEPDSEPTPARMAEIIDYVKANDVKVIFSAEAVNQKTADAVAEATGASVEYLSAMEGLTDEEKQNGDDYISIMKRNLGLIVSSFN